MPAQAPEAPLVRLVRPRHEHEDGLVPRPEDERLDDLAHGDAARGRGLGGGTGALSENHHLALDAERPERGLDPHRGRRDHVRSSGRNRRTPAGRGVDAHR